MPKILFGLMFLFIGVLVFITGFAYFRSSGNLGLDVSMIQQLRKQTVGNN